MRNLLIAGSALSLLATSAVAAAQTQSSMPDINPTNVSIRVGGVFALNGPLRDQQKLWWGVGAEYQLTHGFAANAVTYFSADVAAQSGSGGHGNFFPLAINERFYFDQTGQSRAYAFVGLGVVIMNVTATNTVGAVRAGLGYEFSQNVFLEGAFLAGGQVDGYQPTSLGVYLGYRF